MGNKSSTEDRKGLRITKISPQSPASKTDIQPYVDFIVNLHGVEKNFNIDTDFYKYIIANENKTLVFIMYNILTKKQRYIELIPSRDWPGADFLLGFKVRYESITNAEGNMYRISKVIEPSLAVEIQPLFDFFIAVNEFEFSGIDDLKQKLNMYQKCELIIYNLEDSEIRNVKVNYDRKKGLGFEISQGYLHDLSYLYGLTILEKIRNRGINVLNNNKNAEESLGFNQIELMNFTSNNNNNIINDGKNNNTLDDIDCSHLPLKNYDYSDLTHPNQVLTQDTIYGADLTKKNEITQEVIADNEIALEKADLQAYIPTNGELAISENEENKNELNDKTIIPETKVDNLDTSNRLIHEAINISENIDIHKNKVLICVRTNEKYHDIITTDDNLDNNDVNTIIENKLENTKNMIKPDQDDTNN